MKFENIPMLERIIGILAVLIALVSSKYATFEQLQWIYPICGLTMLTLIVIYVKRRRK